MASLSRQSMFWRLFHLKNIRILNSITKSKKANVTSCNSFSHPCSYRMLTSVAHKYNPTIEERKVDDGLNYSVDEALTKIDHEAKQLGRVIGDHVRDVFDKIKQSGTVSSIQSLYLIRCCGALMHDEMSTKKLALVNDMWNEFHKLKVPMDASHYNSLLKVYIENGHQFTPTEFLLEMDKQHVIPNRVTYQRLIDKYCEDGDIAGASTILEFMKEKDMAINESVFNSLVNGHCKAEDFEGAKHMLKVMAQSNLQPSIETYAILVKCYAQKGDIESVSLLLDEIKTRDLFFTTKHYLHLIYNLAVSGHECHIDNVLNNMSDLGNYRQDCLNTVFDLVHKGSEDVAYKLISYFAEHMAFNNGIMLFLRLLAIAERPVNKAIGYCIDIQNKGFDNSPILILARFALEQKKCGYAIEVFSEMQKRGIPVRTHYFWPIFAANRTNSEEILKTLKTMFNLGVAADFDTYFDYVLPNLSNYDLDGIVKSIKETGHSELPMLEPLFHVYCSSGDFKNATKLIQKFSVDLNISNALKILAVNYRPIDTNRDTKFVIDILHCLQQNLNVENEYGDIQDLYGSFMMYLIDNNKLTEHFLKEAAECNVEISRASADQICSRLRERNRHFRDLLPLVRNLQYNLQKVQWDAPVQHNPNYASNMQMHVRDMTLEQLETQLLQLKKDGHSTRSTLRTLLGHHCRNRNVDRILEIQKELDDQGFTFSPASYAIMISSLVAMKKSEEAFMFKKRLDEEFPDFKLDTTKTIEFASLLVECGKLEEAKDVIKNDCVEENFDPKVEEKILRGVAKFLNSAVRTGNAEFVFDMYNMFTSKLNIINPKISMLHSLINIHLVNNDLDKAIEEFKHCVLTYHLFPCLTALMKKCIEQNDSEKLQLVVDITTSHGEKNIVLHELALSFIECGQYTQARKVFQKLGGRVNADYLKDMSMGLFRNNKTTELEQLINATKDLFHVNREGLYFDLLLLHAQNNDYERALEVWNSLQEENIQPSVKTLRLLADLLERNDQPIPFVVPDSTAYSPQGTFGESEPIFESADLDIKTEVDRYLELGDINELTEVLRKMKKGHVRLLSVDVMTRIIDLYATNERLSDVASIVQVMSYTLEKARIILRPLLEKYSNSGDIKMMKRMLSFIPDFTLRSVNFNYFLHRTYLVSGKPEELLSELEENTNHKNVRIFSGSGFRELLISAPHLEERAAKLVENYSATENFDLPKRILWAHYFISGRYDKADEIFKESIGIFNDFDALGSQVIRAIRNTENIVLGRKFIDFINGFDVRQVIKDKAYSCVLDVLVVQNALQDAVEFVQLSQEQQIPLRAFNQSVLIKLRDSLQAKGETFPFAIPSDTSSSSDSD